MPQSHSHLVLRSILLFLSFSAGLTGAQHANGMDMSMDGPMNLASGSMIPYVHFTPGDVLLFLGWVPKSNGAMVGTCIGLFLLGILTRWFAAIRVGGEKIWRGEDAARLVDHKRDEDLDRVPSAESAEVSEAVSEVSKKPPTSKQMQHPLAVVLTSTVTALRSVKIVPQHAYARGIMQVVQSALDFALMLIVMTYQASFIISIVLGLGVGETLFGRYMVML
ncbi:family copper transporter [Pleurotus ostreatus PC15]|uniref:Copper transport protein n=1 Tax=Pleurotus ostreatus (strain PC15) TaxID=1137138 RepID=A0A067N6C2_PLEO1|nr:family copper transporter [Pleurotus ostreatus PC15]